MNRVFITGGAGYVGAVMVPHLLENGYEVTVLDLMFYGEHVLEKHDNLNAVKGDIRDQDLYSYLIQDSFQSWDHLKYKPSVLLHHD